MPSTRPRTVSAAVATVAALTFVATFLAIGSDIAVAQSGVGDLRSSLGISPEYGRWILGNVVGNVILGGLLLVFGPDYADRKVAQFRTDPRQSTIWGVLVSVGVPVTLFALVFSLVGIILALPGVFVFAGVFLVASAVTVVLAGSVVGDAPAASGRSVLIGSLVVGLLSSIPLVGGLLGWVVTLPGLGMVGHDLYQWVRD
ncbi:hypothetical protein [Halobaculum limi]|uniref:hypothetical protein n=1 Tax=Halobaculum limi TaxID=3031916 RepID=UPI0024067018|nr:hypothetical protein [Halobaculum sp. YSMS11]